MVLSTVLETRPDTSLWLRSFHAAPDAAARLVCLPHAGGSASYYHPVSRILSPGIEVLSVQYPGRQDRRGEPYIDNIPDLAQQVYEQLRHLDDRPLALFGHSMGASVAFEVARFLEEEAGLVLAHLYVSGRRAPSCLRDERIHEQGDAGLIAEMRRLDGTAGGLLDDPDVIRMIIGAIRNDYRAAETYRYDPGLPLSCPVTVLVGDADPKVSIEEARAWHIHTTGAYDLQVYPGGHFYLNAHQADVLRTIRAGLAQH